MIKAVAHINNRATLILGLDRRNTDSIHAAKPIVVDLQAILQGSPNTEAVQDIVIVAGETLQQVHADLARFLPLPPYEEPTA